MNIIVCIKQVPDTADIKWTKNNTIQREGLDSIINPFDEFALESALRIKDSSPDTRVTALSMGPGQAEDALRKIMETAKADITVSPADANKLLAKMAKDIMALVRDYYKYWKPREFIGDTEATQREIILSKCFIGDK